jgi:hypothetical protein
MNFLLSYEIYFSKARKFVTFFTSTSPPFVPLQGEPLSLIRRGGEVKDRSLRLLPSYVWFWVKKPRTNG